MNYTFIDFFKNGIGQIPGLMSLSHLLFVVISIVLITVILVVTNKKTNEKILKLFKIFSVLFLILEILKIAWNLTLREEVSINDWVPLYFCSLFIYASLLFAFIKNKENIFSKIAVRFLFYGGITGGSAFLLLPTTTLNVFPFLHVLSFHSLIYHSFMVVCSFWALRFFTPKLKDIKIYGISVLIVEVAVIIINVIFETNFMLLSKPFDIAILEYVYNIIPNLFPVILSIGQMLVTFYGGYLVYYFVLRKTTFIHK